MLEMGDLTADDRMLLLDADRDLARDEVRDPTPRKPALRMGLTPIIELLLDDTLRTFSNPKL